MFIDTNNIQEQKQMEILKEDLIYKKREKGKYDARDIALVRVTDHLPVNGKVSSIAEVPFVYKMNDLAHEAIYEVLKEQGLSYEETITMAREISPLSTQYRSSIHFCLNGVVSSHMQGNFEGNPFVIIEPFMEHENDNNILSVRGEDTYFKDGLQLSNKAVILVDEKYAEKVIDTNIQNDYEIVFYRGDQKTAVDTVLLNMGIVPEIIGKDYIIDSKTSDYISGFIRKKEYPCDKHCFSESYRQDDEKTLVLWQKYNEQFYTYLYTEVYGNIENKKEEIQYMASARYFDEVALDKMIGIIKSIGIDRYSQIVADYNNSIMETISKGNYPTNNEILAGASLEISNKDKGMNE